MDFQNITDMFLVNKNNHRPMAKGDAGHMKKYVSAYEQGTYLMLEFEKVDSVTGDLSLVDDDITVIMPSDQITGRPYDLRYRAQKLEDVYCVKVTSIDSAKKIVYVSHQEARMEKRPEIEAAIQQYLESNTPVIVTGKILKIQTRMVDGAAVDTGVWLDLCGVGIPAFVYIGNWKKTYTESLRGKAAYGDIIDVKVLERVERKNGMYYYSCSRKELVQDPWESQELSEKYHKGDIVKIRCISKRENKTYTESLRGKAAYGDIIDVKVLERVERKNGMYYYSCSRKELVQDPWESQELSEKYHKGDIVKIRCISKRENNWFGEINGLDDIQVFVEYPSERHHFAIIPGMEYMGTIYYINQDEHSLKARVFQALSLEQLEEENTNVEQTDTDEADTDEQPASGEEAGDAGEAAAEVK